MSLLVSKEICVISAFDEPSNGQFRVCVQIPGIETENAMKFRMCMPKFHKQCRNGHLDVNYQSRGFKLRFDGSGVLKDKHYFLNVQDLPGDLNTKQSSFKITHGRVEVHLVKTESASWMGALVEGLKTVDPALEPPPPYKA
ncbi:hypothetical protein Ciccas_008775 [Cichlidogyrus casuarinus]|uniref:Uncharacterized protein n=1 Tax=Cichlidogyrus casuarinus TaxID=1844966 RepID=A0ABD2PZ20_9PLAT